MFIRIITPNFHVNITMIYKSLNESSVGAHDDFSPHYYNIHSLFNKFEEK